MDTSLADTTQAVEIAPRVWWVSSMLPNDNFQCHTYLIEQGDQSVIIDPGSALIAGEIIRKVDDVIGLKNVRWLVCSHSDPDILGALPEMIASGLHPEALIVTHWRDEALIVHSGLPLKYWRIEEHDWQLPLLDRTLQFVFTPYLHFAGAFGTFDPATGTLFSSDLFGGFTYDHALFASSVEYFDAIRAFHEHYMPNRDILDYVLQELRQFRLLQIAPQHGQIIPEHLIAPIMDLLENLECGIYLLAREDPGLAFLLTASETLHRVKDLLVKEQHFSSIATYLAGLAQSSLGADYLEFWWVIDGAPLRFDQGDGFAGQVAIAPLDVDEIINGRSTPHGGRVLFPLQSIKSGQVNGVMVMGFGEPREFDEATIGIVSQIVRLVEVGLERDASFRSMEIDRTSWKTKAVHDSLTGLLNRASLEDSERRLVALDDLNSFPQLAALMVDVDFFKRVNDTLGHLAGDQVLARVAHAITTSTRSNDLAFRYGGEEFLVLLTQVEANTAVAAAERIRTSLHVSTGSGPEVKVSIGVAVRQVGEDADSLVDRADRALYRAKSNGRDQICVG